MQKLQAFISSESLALMLNSRKTALYTWSVRLQGQETTKKAHQDSQEVTSEHRLGND